MRCGKEKADKGRTRCLQCRFIHIEDARRWQEEHKEQNAERNRQYQRERRAKLKEQGLCQMCGKPAEGKTFCKICANKRTQKLNDKRHANGVMPREMMGDGTHCYFCGKPVEHKGDKTCNACHKRCAEVANANRMKIDYVDHKWRKAEALSFARRESNNER